MRLAAAARGYAKGRRGLLTRGRSSHAVSPWVFSFAKWLYGAAVRAPCHIRSASATSV